MGAEDNLLGETGMQGEGEHNQCRRGVVGEDPAFPYSSNDSFRAMVPYLDAPYGAESGLWSGIVDASRRASCTLSEKPEDLQPGRKISRPKASATLMPQRWFSSLDQASRRRQTGAVSSWSEGVKITPSITVSIDWHSRR